jgi:alpha-L-fucosidase 2
MLFAVWALAGCKLVETVHPSDGEQATKASDNERLWYRYPGQEWNSQALHLGNGYFGASFFGGVKQEKFTLGEKTFWTGGPGDSTNNTYGVNPGGKEHVQEIRRLIVEGKTAEADGLAWKCLLGDYSRFGAFSTVGNLYLNFEGHDGEVADYRRELDLHHAIGSVAYEVNGVRYRREYFCSYPARALIIRLTCDKPGALSLEVGIDLAHKKRQPAIKISPEQGIWEASGNIDDNNRPYRAIIKVLPERGALAGRGDVLVVKGADAVTVIYTVATDYRLQPPDYRGADPRAITAKALEHLAGRNFQAIREEHIRDYQRLYLRTQFRLDGVPEREALPTNERWRRYVARDYADLGLKELAFNLGKYLLISASRPGSLPAGIQGPWSCHYSAP